MRQETSYIVIHCSQTRPSQNIGAKEIDRWHRERGWLKIGYHIVIKRDGIIEQGREDDEVPAAVKGYNHTSFNLCLVGGAKEEDWKIEDDSLAFWFRIDPRARWSDGKEIIADDVGPGPAPSPCKTVLPIG